MVIDAAGPSVFPDAEDASNYLEEDPNPEAQRMFDRLACASKPLYLGCDVSQLAAATALLNIKAQFNMPERGYNLISEWSHWWAPSNTTLPDSLYNMKKLVEGLGLPIEKIDCCKNGYMIYWAQDEGLFVCKFCNHPRYKIGKRRPVPYSRMFYLPITQRLQRLYASQATATHISGIRSIRRRREWCDIRLMQRSRSILVLVIPILRQRVEMCGWAYAQTDSTHLVHRVNSTHVDLWY